MSREGRLSGYVALMVLLAVLTGCASTPEERLPGRPGGMAGLVQSDAALFLEGFSQLAVSYDKAREAFSQLITLYPKSKWRPYAETYVRLLDELNTAVKGASTARKEGQKAKIEIEELQAALDQSKKANRLLQDRLQQENARLQQENDQLKNDIERLKQLEIDLQKRERSFR